MLGLHRAVSSWREIGLALEFFAPLLPSGNSATIVPSCDAKSKRVRLISRRSPLKPTVGSTKIGLLGLGLMGRPMGINLIKAGYSLTVWNRTSSRAGELVAAGATLAKSPQEVAASSDFLLTIVSDPPALEEILWGPSGAMQALQRGSTYIDSSTISPALARKIAAASAERGVRFLDAPVTGGDWGAKKGELIFMVGGDADTLKDVEPLLGVLGKKWFHLGPHGAGQTVKLAMNLILALQVDALAEEIGRASCRERV